MSIRGVIFDTPSLNNVISPLIGFIDWIVTSEWTTENSPNPGSVLSVLPYPTSVPIPEPTQSNLRTSTLQSWYKKLFGSLVIILFVKLFSSNVPSTPSISKIVEWLYNQVSNLGPDSFSPK